MKIALITDTHFGARSDSQIFSRYFERFYDTVFFPYLKNNDIDTVIHLGDLFERRKYINFQSLHAARRYFFEPMRNYTMHTIVGNHDVALKNTNEINSPELLLKDYPNIKVYVEPTDITVGDEQLAMLPWVCTDNFSESMEFIQNTKAKLLFGHLEIIGFEMHVGHPSATGFSTDTFAGFEQVYSGHFHHKSDRGNISYLGSPYEITWNDFNDPRGFHILDLDTRQLEFIQNPYAIFHRVRYNDTKPATEDFYNFEDFSQFSGCFVKLVVEDRNDKGLFQRFVQKIEENRPADLIFEDKTFNKEISEHASFEGIDDIQNVIRAAAGSFPKEKIKKPLESLLLDLHYEAVSQTTTQ